MESLGIQGSILRPADGEEYTKSLHRNSILSVLEPKYIVLPVAISDIPPVLSFATAQSPPLEIAVKCGGAHSSTWASSEGGIVIDLKRLNAVRVSDDRQSVVVQGGANWGDVYVECQKAKVDVVGGPFWFVGVGGYLSGGGYSSLSSEHGLAIDNMLDATVVLANGRIVKTSISQEPELFWAIRGGGNQFGIIVEVTLKAFPQAGPFTVGALVYPGTEITNVLKIVQDWKATFTTKERINVTFSRPPPHFKPTVIILPWVSHDTGRSKQVLAPFRDGILKPVADTCATVPDMLAVSHSADAQFALAPPRLTIRGALVADLWADMMLEVWEKWRLFTEDNEDANGTTVLWELNRAEKIAEVRADEMAFHARVPHYWVAIQGRTRTAESDGVMQRFVAEITSYVHRRNREKTSKDIGFFLNFAQGDEAIEEVYGPNLPKLRKLKAKYDPRIVWNKGCVIEPDFER